MIITHYNFTISIRITISVIIIFVIIIICIIITIIITIVIFCYHCFRQLEWYGRVTI